MSQSMVSKSPSECISEALQGLGLNLDEDGLTDTPRRIASAWKDFICPEAQIVQLLERTFDNVGVNSYEGMVVQTNIPFRALCEHHFFPFFGEAHVAYIPKQQGKIIGLSKIARVVDLLARRRPTVQERVTEELASLFYEHLDSEGAAVVIDAEHTCMTVRGARSIGTITTTASVKGLFLTSAKVRDEFYEHLRARRER